MWTALSHVSERRGQHASWIPAEALPRLQTLGTVIPPIFFKTCDLHGKHFIHGKSASGPDHQEHGGRTALGDPSLLTPRFGEEGEKQGQIPGKVIPAPNPRQGGKHTLHIRTPRPVVSPRPPPKSDLCFCFNGLHCREVHAFNREMHINA